MCDPISITTGLMMLGGTALQIRAQNQQRSDMRRLNREETAKTDAHYAESKKYLDQNQSTYDRGKVDADMAAAAAGRQAQYAAADRNSPRSNDQLPGANSTNAVVGDAFQRALAGAKGEAGKIGDARSQLASFGDFMTNAAINNQDRSNKIGMIGSFQNGDENAFELRLHNAATKPRGAATLGNLLVGLSGALGGMGGAGGASANSLVGPGTAATVSGDAGVPNLFAHWG